ncbi:MAG: hypothetical protein ABIJ30_06715 [bacterium]
MKKRKVFGWYDCRWSHFAVDMETSMSPPQYFLYKCKVDYPDQIHPFHPNAYQKTANSIPNPVIEKKQGSLRSFPD